MANPECNAATNITATSGDISGQVDNIDGDIIELVYSLDSPGGPYNELCAEEVGDNSVDQPISCELDGLEPGTQVCYRVQVRNVEDPEGLPWVDNMDGTFTKTFTSGVEITMTGATQEGGFTPQVTTGVPQCVPPISNNALALRNDPALGQLSCNTGVAPPRITANFEINQPSWGPKLGFRMYDFDNFGIDTERFRSTTHGIPDEIPPGYFQQASGDPANPWIHAANNNATAEFTWNDPAPGTFSIEFQGCCFGVDFSVFYTEASAECCFFTPPGPPVCADGGVPINGATDVTFTSATLNGASLTSVEDYDYQFRWGTSPGGPYPFSSPIIEENAPVEPDVFSYPTGDTLDPGTTYCYVVQIYTPEGELNSQSEECCFTTPEGAIWCGGFYDPNDCLFVDTAAETENYFNCQGAEVVGP